MNEKGGWTAQDAKSVRRQFTPESILEFIRGNRSRQQKHLSEPGAETNSHTKHIFGRSTLMPNAALRAVEVAVCDRGS
jgi:hypothetical protein